MTNVFDRPSTVTVLGRTLDYNPGHGQQLHLSGFLWLIVSKINRRPIGFVQNVFWYNGISLALYPVYQHPVLSTISRSARIQWWDVGLPLRWTEGNSQLRFRQKSLEESRSRTIIWYDIQYSWTGASKLIKTLMWS